MISLEKKTSWKKPLLYAVVISGLAFGGYTLFKKNSGEDISDILIGDKSTITSENIASYIASHPEQANEFLYQTLIQTKNIEKRNYLLMFEKIKERAEERPELLDHLGPNAQKYMHNKSLDALIGRFDEAVESASSTVQKYGEPITDAFNKLRGYLMKDGGSER